MHSLNATQAMLQRIYDVATPLAVEDFLVTDREVAATLDTSSYARCCDEKLLVAEDATGLALSLFVDGQLLERLAEDDPNQCLHDHNLADFCTALEGVSHFLYLTHRAISDRTVTLLELELQAEVDKYVGILTTLGTQGSAPAPRRMLRRLFSEVSFDEQLGAEELARYKGANALAERYCEHLEQHFIGKAPLALARELRHFYQLTQTQKLRHITRLVH
jgi:hypothetical protein